MFDQQVPSNQKQTGGIGASNSQKICPIVSQKPKIRDKIFQNLN